MNKEMNHRELTDLEKKEAFKGIKETMGVQPILFSENDAPCFDDLTGADMNSLDPADLEREESRRRIHKMGRVTLLEETPFNFGYSKPLPGIEDSKKIDFRETVLEDFDILLTPEAKKVYNNKIEPIIHEYIEESFSGVSYRRCAMAQFFVKPFYLENNGVPFWVIRKMAATFNYLVKEKLIGHGIGLPLTAVPMAKIEKDRDRGLMLLYCYPSVELDNFYKSKIDDLYQDYYNLRECKSWFLDKTEKGKIVLLEEIKNELKSSCSTIFSLDYLNKKLKSKCFVDEGDMGDIQWDSLPDLEGNENG